MGRKKLEAPHERFAAWRKAKGYSQKVAGQRLGISSAWVSYIERGEKLPGSPWLRDKIHRVIGIETQAWPLVQRAKRERIEPSDPITEGERRDAGLI